MAHFWPRVDQLLKKTPPRKDCRQKHLRKFLSQRWCLKSESELDGNQISKRAVRQLPCTRIFSWGLTLIPTSVKRFIGKGQGVFPEATVRQSYTASKPKTGNLPPNPFPPTSVEPNATKPSQKLLRAAKLANTKFPTVIPTAFHRV